jgi:transmembrane sensor
MENTIYTNENIAKYFAGELDERKLEIMEKNLINDMEKEREIKDFSRLWEKSTELATYDKIDADTDWQSVRVRMGFNKKTKTIGFNRYFTRVAAVLVLAVGMAYLFNLIIKHNPVKTNSDYLQFSATNASRDFILPDNSKVTLNKNASLFYNSNYGAENRDVILEGEGFFEVEKNKALPFRVFAGKSTIEVLGTSFNIKPDDNEVVVSVITGHVAFYETTRKENRIDLVKSEQSKFDVKNKVFETKSAVNTNELAWRTHQLIFKHENIKVVFETLADYYEKDLEIKNDVDLKDYPFSNEYSNASIETVIKDINSIYAEKFNIQVIENKLIISRKGMK